MLKKIAKRVQKEITQAFDYMEQAFLVRDKIVLSQNCLQCCLRKN